jgi:hypothetical protein
MTRHGGARQLAISADEGVGWWACVDLNQGSLPYQGVDAAAPVAILTW